MGRCISCIGQRWWWCMHQRCFLVGLCCAADFATGTAAIMTSRGDYLGLYVLQKRRLVRSFNWPWLERGRGLTNTNPAQTTINPYFWDHSSDSSVFFNQEEPIATCCRCLLPTTYCPLYLQYYTVWGWQYQRDFEIIYCSSHHCVPCS